jgi:hypothetical protein
VRTRKNLNPVKAVRTGFFFWLTVDAHVQREEEIILRSATWMRGQQTKIAGAEDLAPLPRPLSPLHVSTCNGLSYLLRAVYYLFFDGFGAF